MSDRPAARGIVLAHGLLAEGLVDAARQITGAGEEVLIGRSNRGLSPEALMTELRQLVGEGPAVIFTDLPSGSCAMTAQRLYREGHELLIVSGVNLSVLVDFIVRRELPLAELGPRLLEKGHAALSLTPAVSTTDASTAISNR